MTNTTTTTEPHTYRIPSERVGTLLAKVAKIASKAARLGVAMPTLTALGTESSEDGDGRVEVTHLYQVTSERVVLAGWTFLAKIEHLGPDGNLVSAAPDANVEGEILKPYWHAAALCDHCKVRNNRKTTFVLRHEDGTIAQVGSTCLQAHLGGESVESVLGRLEIWDMIRGACDEGGGGGGRHMASLVSVVALASAVARRDGWLSRTKARESHREATADTVWMALFPSPMEQREAPATLALVTEADRTFARAAVEAAQAIEPSSDYEHNLHVISKVAAIDSRMAGLGASIYVWYRRKLDLEIERASRPASRHLGVVGQDIMVEARLRKVIHWDGQYATTHMHTFETMDGAIVTWKTSSASLEEGEQYRIWAKVKAHGDYKGVAQTEVTRPGVHVLEGPLRAQGAVDVVVWDAKAPKAPRKPRAPRKAKASIDHVAAAAKFQIGDHVEFDGSGDSRHPRLYRGVIREIGENGLMLVISDEWSAQCAVAAGRAWHVREEGAAPDAP